MLNWFFNNDKTQLLKSSDLTKGSLTIYFYLTHIKREEVGPIIRFLQKFNINFSRIQNAKQKNASQFIIMGSNFMAQNSRPISFEEFETICKFLNTQNQVIIVGYKYENTIWDKSRTKTPSIVHPLQQTWNIWRSITG